MWEQMHSSNLENNSKSNKVNTLQTYYNQKSQFKYNLNWLFWFINLFYKSNLIPCAKGKLVV